MVGITVFNGSVKEAFNSAFFIYEIEYNFANENSILPVCLEVSPFSIWLQMYLLGTIY